MVKVLPALVTVHKAKGKAVRSAVPGALRPAGGGRRVGKSNRGGARLKGSGRKPEKWVHEHVRGYESSFVESSLVKYERSACSPSGST